ncbi:MAG TPA: hypothetical protein PKL17_09920 [Pseudomonadota bacterium]|jgi:hypothetical protein|nr:hypothetical protein [Pseudomonadota bacterium]HNF96461.1 hypothetical protein [Pseudomonadota bacterium]HNK45089.1 hypothetical protein [Pseudomonadota bacterium]
MNRLVALLGLWVCAAPLPAHSQTTPEHQEKTVVHSAAVDYGSFVYLSPGLPIQAGGAALQYRARFSVGVAVSAGVRFLHVDRLPDHFGYEGFVGVQLAPIFGSWRPLAGLEVGATSLQSAALSPSPSYSPEEYTSKQSPLGPVYAGFVIAPLRFGFKRFSFLALGIQLATHLPKWGSATRLSFLVGQFEVSF